MGVGPDAQIAMGDTAFGRDGCGFREDQAGARPRQISQMNQMPILRQAVFGRILTHRGDDDSIGENCASKDKRLEQQRQICHVRFNPDG